MTDLPKISIVIPIRNEGKYIASTITYLQKQDYPADRMEILVADSGSNDRTREIVADLAARDTRIRLFDNPRQLASAGRNIGVRNATADIITFIDGHTYIDNDLLLKNTVKLMAEKDVSVLSRPQFLETPDNNFFQRAVSFARKSVIGHGLDSTIYTDEEKFVNPSSSGATYRKEVFGKVGEFDERFDACEDVEFNYRVHLKGYDSFTSPRLAVYYYPRDSVGGLFRQLKRYGIGRFRLACKHRKTLTFGTLIPFFITVGFPLLGILSFFSDILFYVFLVSIILYLATVLALSLAISLKRGISYFLILPVIFVTIHGALGIGFLTEFVRTLIGKGVAFCH